MFEPALRSTESDGLFHFFVGRHDLFLEWKN